MATTHSPPKRRIIFTGGSGEVGRHIISHLHSLGHSILNLDQKPLPDSPIQTILTDLTQPGAVFSAFRSPFSDAEFGLKELPTVDALYHFAAFPRPLTVPESHVFLKNTTATWNVLDTACALGIKKIVLASSGSLYGGVYSQGEPKYTEFPVDESYDVVPEDGYALSKLCSENTARGLQSRYSSQGIEIYALRFGAVVLPDEYSHKRHLWDPIEMKRIAWSYTDIRDLSKVCELALEKTGVGWGVFNVVNDSLTGNEETEVVLKREFPDVKVTKELGKWEAPISNRKVKEVFGWEEGFSLKGEVEKVGRGGDIGDR